MELTPNDAQRLAGLLLDADAVEADKSLPRLPLGKFSRYQIVRLIGKGGMGEVYEARQDNPERSVAVKVIRPDVMSPELLHRFKHETRVLASLQHPGIAAIYEAGHVPTPDGPVPFFAMEYVNGRSLTAYASGDNLSISGRLELFLHVCEAVEYAHRKGIIHRDLKPANILVDLRGRPRILDFGIARVTDSDIRTTSLQTEVGKLVGTLPYMSPEQASGDSDELDTRSDVYSLGVILYELLSGRSPFDFGVPERRLIPQALRAILESEPLPLSSLGRVFRGDLETIVGKALAKEKGQRYQSVSELSVDIRYYLLDQPITARRPSAWYQLCKFARRNRGLTAAVAIAGVTLALGGTTSAVLAVREARAKDEARLAAADALARKAQAEHDALLSKAVTDFLLDVLASPDPTKSGKDVRVVDVLNKAADRAHAAFASEPSVYADVLARLAETYRVLGQHDRAEVQLRTARQVISDSGGAGSPRDAQVMNDLAVVLVARGKLDEAEGLYAQALSLRRAAEGTQSSQVLTTMNNLAGLLQDRGKLEESEQLYTQVVEGFRRVYGADHPSTLTSMNNLAVARMQMRRFELAEPVLTELVRTRTERDGPDHPSALRAAGNLVDCLRQEGKLDSAEPLAIRTLEATRRVFGDHHIDTAFACHSLACLRDAQGLPDQALALHTEAADIAAQVLPAGHPRIQAFRAALGSCLGKLGDDDRAEQLLTQSYDALVALNGKEHPSTKRVADMLVEFYADRNRSEDAAKYHSESPASEPRSQK